MAVKNEKKFYINGQWVDAESREGRLVINPATEEAVAEIALGATADLDQAVKAARTAFEGFSQTTREERLALLDRIIDLYKKRAGDMTRAIQQAMGAPVSLARELQVPSGLGHLEAAHEVLSHYAFEDHSNAENPVFKEPIGVCGFITPWNWPQNQITSKVGPAIATGCTMVLKPSEIAPLDAHLFAEILDEAGVPAGVFNLVDGDGSGVGSAMTAHPDIDMISFTGSTRGGIAVARSAAPTIKRVAQELGGKSANIVLDDARFKEGVRDGTLSVMYNTGQSCNAPTRMFVPQERMEEAAQIAAEAARSLVVGDPELESTDMGPIAFKAQYEKVLAMIQSGLDEGAILAAGGLETPEGCDKGYFVKPTVFSHVTHDMTISREEIFGPVLSILGYHSEEEAIRLANDSPYGLAAYISSQDLDRARTVAKRLRAGRVVINGHAAGYCTPFGGYKQSGNGREFGRYGFEELLETKAIVGYRQ